MRPSTSLVPTAACAVGSTTTSIPAARMCPPPIPTKRTPGSTARRARQSVPPWRSPEASPAESMIGARPAVGSATVIGAHQGDPRPIGELDDRLAVDEQHAPGRHRERGGAALAHRLDGGGADGRHVEAIVVGGGYRLHHHRAGARETAAAANGLVRPLGRLGRDGDAARAHHRLPDAVVGEAAGEAEALADLAPLLQGGRARGERRGREQPRGQELALVEDVDAHAGQGGDHHLPERGVGEAAAGEMAVDFQNLPTKTAAATRCAARPAITAWMSVIAEGMTWSADSARPGASSK